MIEFLTNIFSDYTLQVVACGALIVGITAGSLGAFAVLRQQSLLGDAIAHATLPGVGIAFLLTQSKSPLVLLIGAGLAGWIGTLWVKAITSMTRIQKDAALGMVLSIFFGFGLMMITIVQKLPTATKSGLDKFLFGNAATLLKTDVYVMLLLSMIAFAIVLLFWKEFKIITFDPEFAQSIGVRVHVFDVLLTTLIVIAIVIGLQTVGVVLMSAMLVAPAAAARQWTNKLGTMVVLSAIFGSLAGVSGSISSSLVTNLPTGPVIVLYVSGIVFFSLLFALPRGLLWDWLRNYGHRRQLHMTAMLKNLLLFSEINTNPFHPHDIAALEAVGRGTVKRTMQALAHKGWVQQLEDKHWALTPEGLAEAQRIRDQYEQKTPDYNI